jgi:hypothetical protein
MHEPLQQPADHQMFGTRAWRGIMAVIAISVPPVRRG